MADNTKIGTPWSDDELNAIVADYFVMLAADLARAPYTKARHSAALMERIGRTRQSVEFKHQNISAVLDELGLPWIPGYKPKRNYQNAIFDAIDRHLTRHPGLLETSPPHMPAISLPASVFVAPPAPANADSSLPERLLRLIRKFDPVERDHRNRALGRAGEEYVFHLERQRLTETDRPDLARKVRWVAAEDGDGAGYDILSFDAGGRERLLEVKTTNGSKRTPFFLTRNEHEIAQERAADWYLYRVHQFATSPRIFTLTPPLDVSLTLRPETWRACF